MITRCRRIRTLYERIEERHWILINEALKDSLTTVFRQIEIASNAILRGLQNQKDQFAIFFNDEEYEVFLPQPVKVQEAIAFLLFFHFCDPEEHNQKIYEAFCALGERYENLTQPGSLVVRVLLQCNTWEEIIETLVALKEQEELQDFQAASRNWKDSFANFLKKLKLRREREPRYPQRKRGYTDKGSLADPQVRVRRKAQAETSSALNTEAQNELETQREDLSVLIETFNKEKAKLQQEYQNLLLEIDLPEKKRTFRT